MLKLRTKLKSGVGTLISRKLHKIYDYKKLINSQNRLSWAHKISDLCGRRGSGLQAEVGELRSACDADPVSEAEAKRRQSGSF